MPEPEPIERVRRRLRAFIALMTILGLTLGGAWLMKDPESPLPNAWNPLAPLDVADPYTVWTDWKLSRAVANTEMCMDVLSRAKASQQELPDLVVSDQCGIEGRVKLSSVGQARMAPFETRCAVALRMAMWEHHGIQEAAKAYLGQPVTRIRHFSSYNCRQMRTGFGPSGRMSTHATADAIDISGFELANGEKISLVEHWDDSENKSLFLKAVRDSSCEWFVTTLSPDYNRLHADHFHLQNKGWGSCR